MKHVAELVVEKGSTATGREILEGYLVADIQNVATQAIERGVTVNKAVLVQGNLAQWELIFDKTSNGVWKLYHAIARQPNF